MKEKLLRTKLWVAVAGIATGIGLVVSGNASMGTATVIVSVLGYLGIEGMIDIKAVALSVADMIGGKDDETEETAE